MNDMEKEAFVGHCPEFIQHIFQPAVNLKKELEDFDLRTQLLVADVEECNSRLEKDSNNAFWRRTLVRNVFSLMEAAAFGMKRMSYHQSRNHEVDFSPAELAILLEEKYFLGNNGEVRVEEKNFQRFVPNLKFAFKAFVKSHGSSHIFDASKAPLKEFEDLRNRLTHPKKLVDLTVTDSDIEVTQRVWNWFSKEIHGVVTSMQLESLPIRMPPEPKTRLDVEKEFIVVTCDGNLFQFETLEMARTFKMGQRSDHALHPLIYRTKDLSKEDEPLLPIE